MGGKWPNHFWQNVPASWEWLQKELSEELEDAWKCVSGPRSVEVTSPTSVNSIPKRLQNAGSPSWVRGCWLFWKRLTLRERDPEPSKSGRWSAWSRFNLIWKNNKYDHFLHTEFKMLIPVASVKKQTSWLNQGKKWGNICNERAYNKRQKNFFNCIEIYTNKFANLKQVYYSLENVSSKIHIININLKWSRSMEEAKKITCIKGGMGDAKSWMVS